MSKYSSGRRAEYSAIRFLSERGYGTVRSAGSKGVFDVVAYNDAIVRFIQIKSTKSKRPSYKKDVSQITETQVPEFASRELWVYTSGKGWTKVMVWGEIEVDCPTDDVSYVEGD